MESQLQTVFKLGWRWGAVVLLDEADVIMAKRSINDLSRSAIVAGESVRSFSFHYLMCGELTKTSVSQAH